MLNSYMIDSLLTQEFIFDIAHLYLAVFKYMSTKLCALGHCCLN